MSNKLSHPAEGGQSIALRFLDFLFQNSSGGYIEFRYFNHGSKPSVVDEPTYISLPLDHDRVKREVLSRTAHRAITVGVAPRCRLPAKGKGGKDEDILEAGCIWADIDYRGDKVAGGGTPIEVVERLRTFPIRPSLVVNSGHGRHVYFVFHHPFSDRAGDLTKWLEMTKRLREVVYGDPSVAHLSRVMRLPGTFNAKYEPHVPCEIVEELSSWMRYDAEEVRDAIEHVALNAPAPGVNQTSRNGKDSRECVTASDALSPAAAVIASLEALRRRRVSEEVVQSVLTGKRTIRTGPSSGRNDDESARDFWIATTLLEKGFTPDQVKDVFRSHPSGCGSKFARKHHGERYLNLTLDKAVLRCAEKKLNEEQEYAMPKGHGSETYPTVGAQTKRNRSTRTDLNGEVADGEIEANAFYKNGLPHYYEHHTDGSIWFAPPPVDERRPATPVKVCNSPVRITEIQENIDTGQITVSVGYRYLDRTRETTIARSQMSDARQLVAALAGEGAPITSNNAKAMISFLSAYEHTFAATISRKKVTSKFGRGRANKALFLPGLSKDVEFAPQGAGDGALYRAYASRRGSLQGWREAMDAVSSESLIIPQAVILATFVPPLQGRLQIPNFIVDLNGNTSTGKSTSLKLAASVFGNPDDKHPDSVILQWNNTKVAGEQIAGMCCDLPIFLDDAQYTSDDLRKTMIYMIANGRGKGRGARGGGIRETQTWRTVALSTSEEPLHESSPHEGARGRLLPLGGLVAPFPAGSGSFVQTLESHVIANHGHAGEAYVRHLNGMTEHEWTLLQQRHASIRTNLIKSSSSDIVGRVSGYIAAIQTAAEIACPLLGLGFKPDVVAAWLMLHLDDQQQEQNLVLCALRVLADHYVSNTSLFSSVTRNEYGGEEGERRGRSAGETVGRRDLQGAVKSNEFVAFTRSVVENVFGRRKWNTTAILNKLMEAGTIVATEKDRHTKKVSIDGLQHRMVCIRWNSLFPTDFPN